MSTKNKINMENQTLTAKDKINMRNQALTSRESLDNNYVKAASQNIIEKLIDTPEYKNAKIIFTYISVNNEVNTHELIKKSLFLGKAVCVPLCSKGGKMTARKITSLDNLATSSFGIPEPLDSSPIIDPADIDLCIVPCVCADKEGYRVGYGGGYYDRFLPNTSAKKILLIFNDYIYNAVPKEPHDEKADIIITNTLT